MYTEDARECQIRLSMDIAGSEHETCPLLPASIDEIDIPEGDEAERDKHGVANRQWVVKNGDWEEIGRQHENLYDQCVVPLM